MHADEDDVLGGTRGGEVTLEPAKLLVAEAGDAHVVQSDQVDDSAQIDAVGDFGKVRRPDRGCREKVLSELLHSVPAARQADGPPDCHDLVIADHWIERHAGEARELTLEVSVSGSGEFHVAEEEEGLCAAPARLRESPWGDMEAIVARVTADREAKHP